MTTDTPSNAVLALDQFLNEPPENESARTVRDFRYEAYAKWRPVAHEIATLRAALAELVAAIDRRGTSARWGDYAKELSAARALTTKEPQS